MSVAIAVAVALSDVGSLQREFGRVCHVAPTAPDGNWDWSQ